MSFRLILKIVQKPLLWVSSYFSRSGCSKHGKHLRVCSIFWEHSAFLNRTSALFLAMFSSLLTANASSEHLNFRQVAKASDDDRGAPRRHAFSGTNGINCCRGRCSIQSPERVMVSHHLSRLSWSPIKPHSRSMRFTSSATTAVEPPSDTDNQELKQSTSSVGSVALAGRTTGVPWVALL